MRFTAKLAALLGLMSLLAACGEPIISADTGVADTATTTTTVVTEDVEVPEGPGRVDSLDEVQEAVVYIRSEGTFAIPQGVEVANVPGAGSGFVIDESGLVLTNNHVVRGAAFLDVYLDGEQRPRNARVVAVSECSDLALIDVDGDFEAWLGFHEGDYAPGFDVYSAGFPLGDPEYALTEGVVARAPRPWSNSFASVQRQVQHTASILPGNSGGPLVTPGGEVLAVNYSGNAADQYFAIDGVEVQELLETLREGEDVTSLGLNIEVMPEVMPNEYLPGIFVSSVETGSPADTVGIQSGDILIGLEGIDLTEDETLDSYCRILRSHDSGDPLSVEIFRPDTAEFLSGTINAEGRELEVTG